MKKIFLCFMMLYSIADNAQEKWTLNECILYAKDHNIAILKQHFANKIIEKDVTVAKGNYFPDLSFNGSQGYSLGNSFNVSTGVGQQESRYNNFSLSSSVNLFNGFRNKYELQQAKLNKEKGAIDLEKLRLDLSLNVSNKYLQILFNKEILLVAKEQKLISEQEVKRLTKLFSVTLKPKNELLEMEATFALDTKEVIIAENNLKNNLIELQELLGVEEIENFDVATIELKGFDNNTVFANKNNIYNTALEINPVLKSTELDSKILQKKIKVAKSNFYPRINLSYSYGSNYYHIQGREDLVFNQVSNQFENNGFGTQLDNNRTHNISITASIPIFNRFLTQSNLEKSKIELEQSNKELESQKSILKNQIEIAYNDVVTAQATLEASKAAKLSQKEAFSIAQQKYNKGFISSFDFLNSKSKYIKTQSELIKSKYDYLFKIKVLEYYKN